MEIHKYKKLLEWASVALNFKYKEIAKKLELNTHLTTYAARHSFSTVSGEFVNLGVVAYDPSARSLESEFINTSERILYFFRGNNGAFLIKLVKVIKEHLNELSFGLQAETSVGDNLSIETITRTVLSKDDSSLIFSVAKSILDVSARTA